MNNDMYIKRCLSTKKDYYISNVLFYNKINLVQYEMRRAQVNSALKGLTIFELITDLFETVKLYFSY